MLTSGRTPLTCPLDRVGLFTEVGGQSEDVCSVPN